MDLLELEKHSGPVNELSGNRKLAPIISPLQTHRWAELLCTHPDQSFADYILRGLEQGFHVGFKRGGRLQSCKKNMLSALEHPEVVQKYLQEECQMGRVLGPFDLGELPGVHVSKFGVIPKSNQPGKWRLILDLSSPNGASVNDGIQKELCSLQYVKVDEVVEAILTLGRGTELAKIDIKSAYRIVPVHPEDRPLLGMRWQGKIYVDATLPFGLRSAPKIFNALADAAQWIIQEMGARYLWHYLDDFITIGAACQGECRFNCEVMRRACEVLGIPLAFEKCEGPTCCLVFLGIIIDTIAMELRLPQEKLIRLHQLIEEWLAKKPRASVRKRDLASLAGHLQHACIIIRPGRTFLRRIFDLLATVAHPDHYIRLSAGFRSDLMWWKLFLGEWNGISLMRAIGKQFADVSVFSDASGNWGCGAYSGSQWFQLPWTGKVVEQQIAVKELIPVVVAAVVWGKQWKGLDVKCHSDNQAVVAVMQTRTSRDPNIMHLLRCLSFMEARFEFYLSAEYIPGSQNDLADDLSRNRLSSFLQKATRVSLKPTAIPQSLRDLLLVEKPDWLSQSWTHLFNNTLKEV